MHKCLSLNGYLAAKLKNPYYSSISTTMISGVLGIGILSTTPPWLTTTLSPAAFAQGEDNNTCRGHPATIISTSGSDNIVGTYCVI